MTKAMGSPYDVSGAAHLPDYLAARLDGVGRSDAATLLRIEGDQAPSVRHRIDGLERALRPIRAMAKLDERASRPLWRAIRDAKPLAADTEVGARPLWRISTAPGQGCEIAARISPASQLFFDWAGGLVWVAPPAAPDCGAAAIRHAVAEAGGHATLVRGPAAARASVDVFEPAAEGACGPDQARQGKLRSQGRAQPRADVGGRVNMQTSFSLAQLADPDIAEADQILRACVHCGFCTATCPTYLLLGDEDDSPRGRIYLIKDMLEKGEPARREVVKHIDRCLSCLSCMTTCPSGVHYMHLVDHARAHMEKTYRRPYFDRLMRAMLAQGAARSEAVPDGAVCRFAGEAADAVAAGSPGSSVSSRCSAWRRHGFRTARRGRRRSFPAPWPRRGRVALLVGLRRQCAGAGDQCVRDSRSQSPRFRCRDRDRRRMLWITRPSHGR